MLAWFVAIAAYPFTNDHFGRISAARQIARYGELPFRDFLDPGYVFTEVASAGMQLLFGDSVIGEMLLTSAFIATGAVLVIMVTRRFAPSRLFAAVIGIVAIMAAPRPYDYDKFLFYPLGILLCWRYADRPSAGRLGTLAACAVIAGMFRYDNGLFVLAAGLTTVVTLHARDARAAWNHAGVLLLASAACAAPYVIFLELNGGLSNAVDQMLTYARREGARTRLRQLPPLVPSELRVIPLPEQIQIRWAPSADDERARLESRYTLHDGARDESDARTWLYAVDDTSRENLRALIDDPQVADTHLVDRARARLVGKGPLMARIYRQVPLIGQWGVSWTPVDAVNALYWLFWAVPIAAAIAVWRGGVGNAERAGVAGTATMAVLIAVFILREPLVARVGGAVAPTLILGAWLWGRVRRNWLAGIVGIAAILTIAAATDWHGSAERLERNVTSIGGIGAAALATPPSLMFLPSTPVRPVVEYVRRCTRAEDRVFTGWFVPELYFFSQRAFAGGMPFTFGRHWSEDAYQRRIVAKLASESVPIVILPHEQADFKDTYGVVDAYLRGHYRSAGPTTFGRPEGPTYLLLTHKDRVPTGIDPASSMPCFAG